MEQPIKKLQCWNKQIQNILYVILRLYIIYLKSLEEEFKEKIKSLRSSAEDGGRGWF